MNSPRRVALEVLVRVEQECSVNVALDEALRACTLDVRDRALVTTLVDGTLRWQGRLDYQLSQLVPRAPKDKYLRLILRMGAFQLTQLDRVPAHAVVNEAVEQAHALVPNVASAKMVNAVLRRLEREKDTLPFPDLETDPVGYLSTSLSHPKWLVERWLARFGFAETEALLRTNNTPPSLTLRVNRRWITREALQNFLKLREIETEATPISPWGLTVTSGGNPHALNEYAEGLCSIQGEGSMVMVELLRPGRNRDGWDLAAGVGGKTCYLAEWVDDTGTLLASDTATERLNVLRREIERLELKSVTIEPGDARLLAVEPDSKDYALLDAPCSGTGALRRQADARWRKSPRQVTEQAALQRELLQAAARAVKPGGIVLYCTCSLEPEENERVVEEFLAHNPEWSLVPAWEKHPGLPEDAQDPAGYVRLLPHKHNTDGFFAARLVRQL